jgi:glycosyltransferase involved in cell wall biosynthesis
LAQKIEAILEIHLAKVDVIIVHNMLTLVHNLAFIQAFKAYAQKHPEKKIIAWTHDQTFVDNGQIVDPKPGVTLHADMRSLLITPLPEAHYVVISETFKKLLAQVMKLDGSNVQVIPNGINRKKFLEIDDTIWDIMQKAHLDKTFPIILSPVNILQRKNLDYCLDIVAHLAPSYPNMKYLISGIASEHRDTASYQEALKKKIDDLGLQEQVLFVGTTLGRGMTDSELHDLYDIADLVFYFSKQENFGLPILEAGLTKTPIWVSDLAVFHEIGGENLTYVSATHTPQQVATQVHEYLETTQVIGLNRLVRTTYNLETIIKNRLIPLIEG